MQFSCGETKDAARKRMLYEWVNGENQKWHRKFALWPRTVEITPEGKKICVWLGWYERKFETFGDYYGYYAGWGGTCYETRLIKKE